MCGETEGSELTRVSDISYHRAEGQLKVKQSC